MQAQLCPECEEKTAVCFGAKTVSSNFTTYIIEYGLICIKCDYKKTSNHNISLRKNRFVCPFSKCPWCHRSLQEHIIVSSCEALAHF